MTSLPSTTVTGLAVTDTPPAKLVFGLNFNLHGTSVPVSTNDIKNAATNGIEFTLPAAVNLGTLNDFEAWFKKQFGIDLPTAADLPPPLNGIMAKLATLDVSVDQFHVKVPGSASPDPSKLYTLAMSAAWPASEGGIDLIPGVLSIDGAVFGVSNETPKPSN
jgi:hypothetical protein